MNSHVPTRLRKILRSYKKDYRLFEDIMIAVTAMGKAATALGKAAALSERSERLVRSKIFTFPQNFP